MKSEGDRNSIRQAGHRRLAGTAPGGGGTHRELAKVVRQLRRRAGLTQNEVAVRGNISVGGVRDVEQQRVARPRVTTLRRIASALELSPSETRELVQLGLQGPVLAQDLRLQILGPLSITVEGRHVDLGSERQRTMLGLLALSPGASISIDNLIDAAWGAEAPSTATELVRSQMSRLRRRIQPRDRTYPILVATNGGYALDIDNNQLDLLAFRELIDRARRDGRSDQAERATTGYEQAMELWRGQPLSDLPGLQELADLAKLRRELDTVLLEYADVAASFGRHDELLSPLYGAVEANPLHEAAHARLITALAGSGRRAVALEVFEELRQRLADELGVDPGTEVRAAHRAALLGELDATQEPAPVTPIQAAPAPRQLPADSCGFTGRIRELAYLDAMLAAAPQHPTAVSIAALLGQAGVGKSSLAVHWAHTVASQFSGGQVYADLAVSPEGRTTTNILQSFLLALGVAPTAVPADLHDRAALYRTLVAGKRILIVLDNAESAEQVRPLLPGSPTCFVIVTSQNPMASLVAAEGAQALVLDLLSEDEALTLLQRRLGPARPNSEPEYTRSLVASSGRLPSALVAVATRAATRPQSPLATLFGDACTRHPA